VLRTNITPKSKNKSKINPLIPNFNPKYQPQSLFILSITTTIYFRERKVKYIGELRPKGRVLGPKSEKGKREGGKGLL
jgi:hypothetical protein